MILSFLFTNPILFFAWIVGIIIAISVHECAHAYTAYRFGDPTARDAGRISLNPLRHLDPIGSLIFLIAGFGWGKPVPVNPFNLPDRKRSEAWISFAGPISNFLVAFVVSLLLRISVQSLGWNLENMAVQFFATVILINLALMIFNLIPIPPLDGSKILFAFLPPRYDYVEETLERSGPMLLFGLLIVDRMFDLGIFGGILWGGIEFLSKILLSGMSVG